MSVFLDEEMVGKDATTIGFPHLLLCMGFVAVTGNDLWGVHLTSTQTSQAMLGRFWAWAQNKGLNAGAITDIYGCCDLKVRYGVSSSNAGLIQWTNEMGVFAGILGWNGPAHGFDTSIINPADGTFVQYDRNLSGNPACRIFYKRDEKTHATGFSTVQYNGGAGDVAAWSNHNNAWRLFTSMKTGIAGNVSTFHWGTIHEVDYGRRLTTINV